MPGPLVRFNLVLCGKERISGNAKVDKYGELECYVSDKDRPLLLDVVHACKIKNVRLTMDLEQARPWIEPSAEVREILAAPEAERSSLKPTKDSVGMSMHFDDADPVAVCLVMGCGQHFHGDSRNDAMLAWSEHVSKDHREDWGE